MRYLLLLALLSIPWTSFSGEVSTRIERVTVYPAGAMIAREGKAELTAGENTLVVTGLSPSLQADSIRVGGSGPGRTTITGMSSRTVYLVDPRHPEVERLEVRLRKLEDSLAEVEGKLEVVKMQNEFLASLRWGQDATGLPAPAELASTVEFIGSAGEKLLESEGELRKRSRKMEEEIGQVEKQLRQLGGSDPRTRQATEVTVTAEAAQAGEYRLELSYMVPGASWRPVYDARGQALEAKVDLTCRAEVRQTSGEDWDQVAVGLSTARPSRGSTPPEPSPWYISFPAPSRPRRAFSKTAAAPGEGGGLWAVKGVTGADMDLEEEVAWGMDDLEASAVETGSAVSFQIERPQEIPSDGKFHGMLINRRRFEGSFEYLSLPRLTESVYLEASFVNSETFPYLPGKINIFNGEDFVGTSIFAGAAPGEKAKLYLGVDDRVKVTRILVKEETEQGGIFRSGTAYRSYAYRIEAKNFSPGPARVGVIDQAPVSREAEIKVELGKISPAPLEEWEGKQPGLMKWLIELAPGKSREITYGYTVQYPADKTVSGL